MIKDVIIHDSVVRMTIDENALEKTLRSAIADPAQRPEFFSLLLQSDVHVLTASNLSDLPDQEITLTSALNVSVKLWQSSTGTLFLPFFSSLQVLQRSIAGQERQIRLPARILFEITRGKTLFLNPKGPYGKEFFPNEIDALLSLDKDTRSANPKH